MDVLRELDNMLRETEYFVIHKCVSSFQVCRRILIIPLMFGGEVLCVFCDQLKGEIIEIIEDTHTTDLSNYNYNRMSHKEAKKNRFCYYFFFLFYHSNFVQHTFLCEQGLKIQTVRENIIFLECNELVTEKQIGVFLFPESKGKTGGQSAFLFLSQM